LWPLLHTTRETVIIEVADRPLFGRVIKQLRDRRGLTQRALAELIRPEPDGRSITTQYLSDIESGRRSPSGDHIISAISIGLGVDPNYLAYVARMLPPEIHSRPFRGRVHGTQSDRRISIGHGE
jgi:transcriptional regulator with XRE-family HTH domain